MPHREPYIELLKQYIPYNDRDVKGIEIGCWKGEFNFALLREFGNLTMVTIDPMPHWKDVINNNEEVLPRLWILPFPSDCAVQFLKCEYDFVFIDGDHSYEQCKNDIINYEKLVKPGGIISGHNYHKHPDSAHPGVHKAVDEIYGDKVKLIEDFTWYVQKPQ